MIRKEYKDSRWKFSFVEYSPENPGEKLPLVIQLHGAGERGDDLSMVDVHGFSHMMDKNFECRFIMPQCPLDTFWAARVESIIEFIDQLKDEFDFDEDRLYLTGLSMGGFGTWFTAMANPALFAAIAPVCGGGMPWNAGVLTMPVWAFHGNADDLVSVNHSDEMVEQMKLHGGDVKYTRLDGVGHNAWDYAYNEELLEWLLSHRR